MKRSKEYDYPLLCAIGCIFFIIYILQYTDGVFSKSGIFPQLMLSCTVFSAMFFGDGVGAAFGFVAGALVDAVSAGAICFNTIIMMLLGYVCGLSVKFLINNNFRSAVLVSVATSFIYYFCKWCNLGFGTLCFKEQIAPSCFLTILFSAPIYVIIYFAVRIRKRQLLKRK